MNDFQKLVLASVASIKAQENRGDSTTKFTFAVDKDSNNNSVRYLMLFGDNWKILNANWVLTTVEEIEQLSNWQINLVLNLFNNRYCQQAVLLLEPTITSRNNIFWYKSKQDLWFWNKILSYFTSWLQR